MAKNIVNLGRDSRGNFQKDIGWQDKPSGNIGQHRFYFGTDPTSAVQRALGVLRCWDAVKARRERLAKDKRGERPLWSSLTLDIAKAVAAGQEDYTLKPEAYAVEERFPTIHEAVDLAWFKTLQEDFGMIRIRLDEEQAGQVDRAQPSVKAKADRYARLATPTVVTSNQTLHAALDAYIAYLPTKYMTPDGKPTLFATVCQKQLETMKEAARDTSLAAFGQDEIDAIADYWNNRPLSKKSGKPIKPETVKNMIKRLNGFIKWLHRSSAFTWRKPEDYESARINIRVTQAERAKKVNTTQVDTYSAEELATLWRYASPRERLYMVLALNCGFGQAEIASLQREEVHLNQSHPYYRGMIGSFIRRLRGKTDVYSEWSLWDVTVAGLEWYEGQRPASKATAFIMSKNGTSLQAPTKGNNRNSRIANAWNKLTERIQKDNPSFRWLPFNQLRKTSGELVRRKAGGEMLAIFHSRRKSVAVDDQAERYTNRPYDQLFAHLDGIRANLAPVFDAVADPFPADGKKHNPSTSLAERERIVSMRKDGASYADIVKATGLSIDTVSRYLRKAGLVKSHNKTKTGAGA
jgi:uncharacterized protein YerC